MMHGLLPQDRRQSGTVLLIALVMLLVMTLLGLSSMRGTALEERMAGNWRDQNIALQAAEAALRAAETAIAPLISPPTPRSFPCATESDTGCQVFEFDPAHTSVLLSSDLDELHAWIAGFTQYGSGSESEDEGEGESSGGNSMTSTVEAPRYLIEHRGYLRDHLGVGHGADKETGRDLYQTTAVGSGQTREAVRLLQSIYAKRYN
ncbi:pilus assembly PilX family protein [Pseudothauera nasutitermitis]|uniref:pilus assembly PilX family protein n=1 Tax=Pseudothauera nasutitermitis TaxID=2565930 RepID=UPI001454D54D|nr:PilX N-terminal domain-containing pilus assembly protein [Pseudothauera nasutitermitis]